MLLLHVCCADCVLRFVAAAQKELDINPRQVHLYFYNPNIHPRSEYFSRLNALKKVNQELNLKIIIPDYRQQEYFEKTKNIEEKQIHDKTIRCPICWTLRLTNSFKYAKKHDYSTVASTITTSTYMDQKKICKIAKQLEKQYKIDFFIPKKKTTHLKTKGFYKQNYCGCVYSLQERLEEKYI